MANQSCNHCKHPAQQPPRAVGEGYCLVHEPVGEGCIDAEEPHIAREAVEHTSDECFLPREPGHLSVGGVAEVGEHQQHHTSKVMPQVGEDKHISRCYAKEDGQYCYDIGMYPKPVPEQCEDKSYRARKVHVEPLLGIV